MSLDLKNTRRNHLPITGQHLCLRRKLPLKMAHTLQLLSRMYLQKMKRSLV